MRADGRPAHHNFELVAELLGSRVLELDREPRCVGTKSASECFNLPGSAAENETNPPGSAITARNARWYRTRPQGLIAERGSFSRVFARAGAPSGLLAARSASSSVRIQALLRLGSPEHQSQVLVMKKRGQCIGFGVPGRGMLCWLGSPHLKVRSELALTKSHKQKRATTKPLYRFGISKREGGGG